MQNSEWKTVGEVEALKKELEKTGLKQFVIQSKKIAISYSNGVFGAISGICNHVGGPLGKGRLDGEYIVCPWHYWKFHHQTGVGEPGYEQDRVPSFLLKIENGNLFVDLQSETPRKKKFHEPHPLERPVQRESGNIRVVGISTTAMDPEHPRYSTSEQLLEHALNKAKETLNVETRILRLSDMKFRNCEGFYSKSAHACTWPCSITQMDPEDEMEKVYDSLVHWADVVLLSTPIRWGSASSLYFKMTERLNCVQNQITLKDNTLINNKVAGFIITGGQDNIQAVAGTALGFFAEIGFVFPAFPYVAHSLGWSAENMERNVRYVAESQELKDGSFALLKRSIELAQKLIADGSPKTKIASGGRKARRLDPKNMDLAYVSESGS